MDAGTAERNRVRKACKENEFWKVGVGVMRSRKTQRALKKAGIRREEAVGPRNAEQYYDLTPAEAVRNIVKKEKGHESEHTAL